MSTPLINIITRVSRPASFLRCLESVNSQTYKNVHHIVTYQNNELKEFLDKFEGLHKVRVPNLKAIEGLAIRHYIHPGKDNFIDPDWEWMEREVITDYKSGDFDRNYKLYIGGQTKPEPVLTVWEEDVFHCSLDHAYYALYKHFPYNSFVKIAEQHVEEGWVMYLDDDDYLERETALEELVEEINKCDEDTIHLVDTMSANGAAIREGYMVNQMKGGMPFMAGNLGASGFIFHTKYIEYTAWDEWSGSDWRTAKCLETVIPKKNWVENYFIKLGGTREDGASRGY
jgi:glycosyltransferase involved in cell wall biosynthesis